VTVTEMRSTAEPGGKYIQGVLFLTAGYGTRAEPLSFCKPKALLPWGNTTLLGNLIRQFSVLDLDCMAFNASRCPELVLQEANRYCGCEKRILFEERPLGTPGTLARNSEMFKGHWIVSNTDMVMDVPVKEMVQSHIESGSEWTVLTGRSPSSGEYGSLEVGGVNRHYLGISIVSPGVASIACSGQIGSGFFTVLRKASEASGIVINEFYTDADWMDMGDPQLFRKHLLACGSYIHPLARVQPDVILQGFYWIGSYCIIQSGAVIKDSVILDGSTVLQGVSVTDTVVPWYSRRSF
jgi:NDP-sugar pyrophosphorylase family protein